MKRALFIFRRDLRLEDNTGLTFALENADEVILSFIFTPEQIENNPFRSNHCLQFLIESLEELGNDISKKKAKLYLFFAKPEEIVDRCIKNLAIDMVVVNNDYTPYSIQRDLLIKKTCEKNGVDFHGFDDSLLQSFEQTLKSDRTPYTIFTPYFRNASRFKVELPTLNNHTNYFKGDISFAEDDSIYHKILPSRTKQQKGGRTAALKILNSLSDFSNYATMRDFPAENETTHLSPHLKFTTCSPREAYHMMAKQLGYDCPLIRSLYWRDFFASIAFHFPHVFEGAFKTKYNNLEWSDNQKSFKKWCEGMTGFPIVDAGMREMNQTGYMHNRVRMIVASFLVKDLHINWQWGEKYFAQTLIDYDPVINNGNWQWSASTGCDAQPYFRIFNPWSQSSKFDSECKYIKHWVPELAKLPPKIIHEWYLDKNRDMFTNYPAPMVDHSIESKIALEAYKSIAS
jgi:deoxyribodipyrimidine photo-lyase